MFKKWRQRRRENQALKKITDYMLSNLHIALDDIEQQVQQELAVMSPERRQEVLRILRGDQKGDR